MTEYVLAKHSIGALPNSCFEYQQWHIPTVDNVENPVDF